MARIINNPIMHGASGMLGDVVVFRQVGGKTIMANRPRKPRFQSERQKEHRYRFKQASAFARSAVRDPQRKEYYLAMAPKLNVTNAYTAALTLYMRSGGKPLEKVESNLPVTRKVAATAGTNGIQAALLIMVCFWIAFFEHLKAVLQNQGVMVIGLSPRKLPAPARGVVRSRETPRWRVVVPLGGSDVTRQMTPG